MEHKPAMSDDFPACPSCGSKRVARILYGLPDDTPELLSEIKVGKATLGGCCIDDNDPKWKCHDCLLKWGTSPPTP